MAVIGSRCCNLLSRLTFRLATGGQDLELLEAHRLQPVEVSVSVSDPSLWLERTEHSCAELDCLELGCVIFYFSDVVFP